MSEKAKEIIELHLGSDYWKFEESEYFDNLVNAIDEALSITPVIASKQKVKCANCSREIETYKNACAPCRIADALLD